MVLSEFDIINEVIGVLSRDEQTKNRYEEVLNLLHRRGVHAKSKTYRLGVIGVTSSGKSTMINALLGEDLLPMAAQPSSSQLVSCRKGRRCAKVYFDNREEIVFKGDKLNSSVISKYGDEGKNSRNFENVKQIEIFSSNFPFDEKVILTDSPGLDAFGYEGHEQITMDTLLPTVDFCIFVTTCKTNSDDRAASFLNIISNYDKPVIIIQNMIDSIVPSPDGAKCINMVASDHRKRLERRIERSNIEDKSSVKIVQISAKWALSCRIVERQGNKLNELGVERLKRSGYKFMIDTINSVFNNLRPKIDSNRLSMLKKEIEEIISEANKDSLGVDIELRFDFLGEKERLLKEQESIKKQIKAVLNSVSQKRMSVLKFHSISLQDISNIKRFDRDCSDKIVVAIRKFNNMVNDICKRLNISSRDLFEIGTYHKKQDLKMKVISKTEKIKKNGVGNYLKRTAGKFFDSDWGYETITYEVNDIKGTIRMTIKYLEVVQKDLKRRTDDWLKSVDNIVAQLNEALDREIRSFEDRKAIILEKQSYKEIACSLKKISTSIVIQDIKPISFNSFKKNDLCEPLQNLRVSKLSYGSFKIASAIKDHLFRETYKYISRNNSASNFVIGWDAYCATQFAKQAFGSEFSPEKLQKGENNFLGISPFTIFHFPDVESLKKSKGAFRNLFILVNATQIGAATKQLNELRLSESITEKDNMFFLIQDFKEVITGDDVEGVLSNMKSIYLRLDLTIKSQMILVVHENPIFNLAIVETQLYGNKVHKDELIILNNLRDKFQFLTDESTDKTLSIILRYI